MPDGFSLDFNHGAMKPVDDPRSRDISDRLNAHIDAALFRARSEEAKREYVGASAIGNECLRAVQFNYAGVEPDDGRITGRLLRIFDTGHHFEDIVAGWLRLAGFELDTIDPATGRQFGFAQLSGKAKGHLDGILRGGPLPMDYPCVWECKALNEKGWQEVKKNGLRLAKPIYAAQVAVNQAYQGLTVPAVFTVLNKNTSELHHELVPFDRELAQASSDDFVEVIQATEDQRLLPRPYNSPDFYKCKMCDFAKTCWKLPK